MAPAVTLQCYILRNGAKNILFYLRYSNQFKKYYQLVHFFEIGGDGVHLILERSSQHSIKLSEGILFFWCFCSSFFLSRLTLDLSKALKPTIPVDIKIARVTHIPALVPVI